MLTFWGALWGALIGSEIGSRTSSDSSTINISNGQLAAFTLAIGIAFFVCGLILVWLVKTLMGANIGFVFMGTGVTLMTLTLMYWLPKIYEYWMNSFQKLF